MCLLCLSNVLQTDAMSTASPKRAVPLPPKPKVGLVPRAADGTSTTAGTLATSNDQVGAKQPVKIGDSNLVSQSSPNLTQFRRVSPSEQATNGTPSNSTPSSTPGSPAVPAVSKPAAATPPPKPEKPASATGKSPAHSRSSSHVEDDTLPAYLTPSSAQLQALATEYKVSASELSSLQMLFVEMDVDNDGVISLSDLLRYKYGVRKSGSNRASVEVTKPLAPPEPVVVVTPAPVEPKKSDPALDEARAMLKDMDLTSSEEDEEEEEEEEGEEPEIVVLKPRNGFDFRGVDWDALPKKDGPPSSDDDELLADWDNPQGGSDTEEDEETKTGDEVTKTPSKSKINFGALRKTISSKANQLSSKASEKATQLSSKASEKALKIKSKMNGNKQGSSSPNL